MSCSRCKAAKDEDGFSMCPTCRTKRRERARMYCALNLERLQKTRRSQYASKKRNPQFWVYVSRQSAIKKQIEWSLSDVLAESLVIGTCYYCGTPAAPVNGIDRVDNGKGYVEGNVVPACWTCNRRKAQADVNEFIGWAIRVAAIHGERSGLS